MSPTRVASPVATRARDAAVTLITLSIAAYVLWVLAVRLFLVRSRSSGRFPRSRKRFLLSARQLISSGGRGGPRETRVTDDARATIPHPARKKPR
jgi:hypothetical protein